MANILIGGTDSAGDGALPTINSADAVNDLIPIYQNSTNSTNAINRNNFLGITGSPVGNSDSQSLTNKTLDNTNTLTVKDGNLTLQNSSSTTKQAKFSLSGITAGQTRTFTLPDYNATIATIAGVETLTNKTLTSPTINTATISNPTLTVDSISGFSSATVVNVANLQISNGVLNTNNSVVTANIADSAVTPAKLLTGTGSGWAYSTWSPTWTNVTVGNGTVVAHYVQTGKQVNFWLTLTWGTTTSVSSSIPRFTLPVTAYSYPAAAQGFIPIGTAALVRQGTGTYNAYTVLYDTTHGTVEAIETDGPNAFYRDVSSTVPATWANTDIWTIVGTYEAA